MTDYFRGRTLQTTFGDTTELHHGFHSIGLDFLPDGVHAGEFRVTLQTTATDLWRADPATDYTLYGTLGDDMWHRLDVHAVRFNLLESELGAHMTTLVGVTTAEDKYTFRIIPATEVPR